MNVGQDFFCHEAGAYLNHSCEPNAGIRKTNQQLFLFAAKPIAAEKEIVIDYSTILGDDDIWTMRCNCGRSACRRASPSAFRGAERNVVLSTRNEPLR